MKQAQAKARAGNTFNPLGKGPMPVEVDVRICFGIAWYATEKEAEAADKESRKQGNTYNGGFFHGMACGREKNWDKEVGGKKLYAVTF